MCLLLQGKETGIYHEHGGTTVEARLRDREALLWLIVKVDREAGDSALLTAGLSGNGEGVLPVFSFKEEAQMYLWGGALGGRWRVEEVEPEALASVLSGPGSRFEWVALDPMGEAWDHEVNRLVCMSRERFLSLLACRPEKTIVGQRSWIEPVAMGRRG